MTKADKKRIQRKIEIAIDKLVDVEMIGGGCDAITRCLEMLNRQLRAVMDDG